MKNKIILEFNGGIVVNYTFSNPLTFIKPFYDQAYLSATEMIYEAISSLAKYDTNGLYTFKNLVKINDQLIDHGHDEISTFCNLPVYNEIAAACIIEQFSSTQESTEIHTTGETEAIDFS